MIPHTWRAFHFRDVTNSTFIIAGIMVCFAAFLMVYGVTDRKFQKIFGYFQKGYKNCPSPIRLINRARTAKNGRKTNIAHAWMKNYFARLLLLLYIIDY